MLGRLATPSSRRSLSGVVRPLPLLRSQPLLSTRHCGGLPGTTKSPEGALKDDVTPPVRRRTNSSALPKDWFVPPAPTVPAHIPRPSYANHPKGWPSPLPDGLYGEVKDAAQINKMRSANGLAAEALAHACEIAREGVTTDEVDRSVAEFVMARGAYPVGINYYGFPRGLCASVNEVALHGVPNTRPLEQGDIVNFDVTVFLDGVYGDCSAMVCVGDVDEDARQLVDATKDLLDATIDQVGPGVKLSELGSFSVNHMRGSGFGVVSEFCGHFIGRELHMQPNVLHVPNNTRLELLPGMTFTIEPILIERSAKIVGPLDDGWTVVSKNGGWSAQWEHTILVTEHGAERLSVPL